MKLFDVFAGCGGTARGAKAPVPGAELAEDMTAVGIEQALVRITPGELDASLSFSLSRLYELCANHNRFVPCPVVLPAICDDVPSENEQIEHAIQRGAAAVAVRPKDHYWRLDHRLPVLTCADQVDHGDLALLAEHYPKLPLLMVGQGYRHQRILLQLLRNFSNLYASLGGNFTPHRGLEQLVAKVGPERVLFGTGWPDAHPMPAVTYMMYADISDEAKTLIGAENFRRLREAIVR